MPLVIALLGWLRLLSVETLTSNRRWALVVCGIVAAMITPADALSMIMMLLPLYGLYELGILLLRVAPASAVAEGRVLRSLFSGGTKPAVTPVASRDAVPRGDGTADEDES
jgi:ACR3 family arsenite efflux pump ArsB